MSYVLGIDLGTSAVKVMLVGKDGTVHDEASKPLTLIQPQSGYSEQNPEEWYSQTVEAVKEIITRAPARSQDIEGLSFSGQMHGLVLLDENNDVLRPAILWNDTRTSKQCEHIHRIIGKEHLRELTGNEALEGFTLPKLLWVKEHEPDIFVETSYFLLPKDYVRLRITGKLHSEYSDAAGTIMLNKEKNEWSEEILHRLGIPAAICPPLVHSHAFVGEIQPSFAQATGLNEQTGAFAGGADNACGAIGSGVLSAGKSLCSIGTSGVLLSYQGEGKREVSGPLHLFHHGKAGAYYTMGVTLSAGQSLHWFKEQFAPDVDFETLLSNMSAKPGASGLLFTPYLSGERTPHSDAMIRGSFIGLDARHTRGHLTRAVIEGITFSLNETLQLLRDAGQEVDEIISIGGGPKVMLGYRFRRISSEPTFLHWKMNRVQVWEQRC
ncbi:xylulokinase [Geomicrobium halophilum]|uniref:Xylulose kinase n=1 Tax=Geomicrobium halophilum TaxID=549000 RepID=A0A841PRB8_9BACL|nr:xylulokinase [Geomicrobium halophilum]